MRDVRIHAQAAAFCAAVIITVSFMSCEDSTAPAPARTAFTWRCDTLRLPGGGNPGMVIDTWGESPSNLFLLTRLSLFAYDGRHFRPAGMGCPSAGLEAMDGTAPDNLWVVGGETDPFVAHFDGAQWRQVALTVRARLLNVAVADSAHVYFAGHIDSLICLENGHETHIALPGELRSLPHTDLYCSTLFHADGIVYMAGWIVSADNTQKPFRAEYENGVMRLVGVYGSSDQVPALGGFCRTRDGGLYSCGGSSIYLRTRGSWLPVYTSDDQPGAGFFAAAIGNFWMADPSLQCLHHANGVITSMDPDLITRARVRDIGRGWSDGGSVFIPCGLDGTPTTVVLIGE